MIINYPLRPLERDPPDDLPEELLLLLLLLEDLALDDLEDLELLRIVDDLDDLLEELLLAEEFLVELLLETPELFLLVVLEFLAEVERLRLVLLVPRPTLRLVVFLFPTEDVPLELARPFLP